MTYGLAMLAWSPNGVHLESKFPVFMGMMDAESRPCFGKPIQRHARMGSMGRMFLVFLSMVCSMLHREDFRCSYMSDDPAHRAQALPRPAL